MNLYRNEPKELTRELFVHPTKEYRGAPFWAWNCRIDRQTLEEQIGVFRQMGMGGFHIHVRTGMETPYLSDEFMAHVRFCLEKGKQQDLLTWLYDEDRWPSGTAGGRVTADHPEYRAMNLLFTPRAYGEAGPVADLGILATGRGGHREENGELLACYDVCLDENGCLRSYRRIDPSASATGCKWYAYAEYAVPSAWFNNHTYLDTLNREAVQRFVEITHERYLQAVGEDFGGWIPAIFTDEPSFAIQGTLRFAQSRDDVFLTWTRALPQEYERQYHESLLDKLPELFWELPERGVSLARYRFHELTTELFASHYADTLGRWCREHELMLSGHLLHEETLESQTTVIGEAMRAYRAFSDMPGIDILCDRHEYNTAKQAQSAKHQQGDKAMLSELYGVSGWDYDFRGYKLQGDWQAALGVTVRVPHLTWMSMKGEAKRDFPACIGYQSPWYSRFSLIEDHFARVNTAMTRGQPTLRLAVIHPIESYWLHWGPSEQTAGVRQQLERHFAQLTETLLFGCIDFDFIAESRLPEQCPEGGCPLRVGAMAYDVVIVPGCETLRATTLARLEAFRAAGGRLIFLDECPRCVDAVPSDGTQALYRRSERVPFSQDAVLMALEDIRQIDIRRENGARTDFLLHQLRWDEGGLWLFIARGKNPDCPDVDVAENLRIRIRGEHDVTLYDTLTGEIAPLPAQHAGGWTTLRRVWHMHDSLLLRLTPAREEKPALPAAPAPALRPVAVPREARITTEEPNVLLLDTARWAVDEGEWQPETEILKADNLCRAMLGLPKRAKHVLQPYLMPKEALRHQVRLLFTIDCETAIAAPRLALEDAETTRVLLDGAEVATNVDGYYVDRAIACVALPPLGVGRHALELRVPFGQRANLEWCYLLGDFGVRVNGAQKTLISPLPRIGYGSVVTQGYPFYTGNFSYHFQVEATGRLRVRVPKYRAALVEVLADGQSCGCILYAPYTVDTPALAPGLHDIELKCYGLRQNGFGQVHHEQGVYFYQNSNSWRSEGDLWLDEYQLHPLGILKTPEISVIQQGAPHV